MLFFGRYGLDIEDEGWFLYASKLISQGSLPYRDFSLHTTPGSLYIQAVIFKLFGSTVMVGRFSMIILGLVVAFFLFYITREIVHFKDSALIPSIIFIFWGITHIRYPWYGWYALAFGVVVPYFILKYLKAEGKIFLFLAGIFCGLTFLMKQNIGTAGICAIFLFLITKVLYSGSILGQKVKKFFKGLLILSFGAATPLCITGIYFYLNNSFNRMLYYIFRHASKAALNRFIFNPFPHIKSSSIFILFFYLLFCYSLYAYIWKGKRLLYGLLVTIILISMAVISFLFIKEMDNLDSIYILDHLKTGFINGFFNLCMASVIFGGYIFLIKKDFKILFITLWALFYIWSSLCISRDHLHLVLGMVPAYILIPLLSENISDKVFLFLNKGRKKTPLARIYSRFTAIYLPFLFICFIGFFSALKNEGLRSVFLPVTQMDSILDIKNAKGIIVSKQDNDMIRGIVEYISQNTAKGEKIFDTHKNTLFYFLSDRDRPSFHLVMASDVMRPNEQEEIIENLDRYNIRLVITESSQWDSFERYANLDFNPLSYKIWRYTKANFDIAKDFSKYYILKRRAI